MRIENNFRLLKSLVVSEESVQNPRLDLADHLLNIAGAGTMSLATLGSLVIGKKWSTLDHWYCRMAQHHKLWDV